MRGGTVAPPSCGPALPVRDGLAAGRPSHHGWLSEVTATFVKIASCPLVASAFGFVALLVPGATPK